MSLDIVKLNALKLTSTSYCNRNKFQQSSMSKFCGTYCEHFGSTAEKTGVFAEKRGVFFLLQQRA
jgi:hypothetical protein